ncbi:MAG TPA: hypothetical protein PKH77_18885 [Anaerolineae bacterium]|nr:hypothetical protein [Anaerolineae bacterium]
MVYDVATPQALVFVGYVPSASGDVSPEGLKFVPAAYSPTGAALLVIANEISGSTAVYEVLSGETAPLVVCLPLVLRQSD